MICPQCNIPMDHLNRGGGFSGVDAYQTYDTLECPKCHARAIEFYHTEFIDPLTIGVPSISISQRIELKRKVKH